MIIPIIGFENITSILAKEGLSLSPSMEPLMVSIPNINMAKPKSIEPIHFFLSVLHTIIIITPIAAKTGVNDDGLNNFIINVSPLIPLRLSSYAVTVVPIFAPSMMLMVCPSFIMPEFTKPTSITVVADED